MIRVGIIGASGYTAVEAIELLLAHPNVQVAVATSRSGDGQSICNLHPQLADRIDIPVENLSCVEIAQRCDIAFCCLPHGASAEHVAELNQLGCRVIDLSADYRLSTPELYHQWYGEVHCDPARLGTTPYGLPEIFGTDLLTADLVANPGCYPTSAILPLAPLILEGLVDTSAIIVDSKSGVSGAGRTAKESNSYCTVNESISAYAIGTHRHQAEIVDVLHRKTGVLPKIVFTPHLVPMERGILSTIYFRSLKSATSNQIRECLATYFSSHPFVRMAAHLPATRFVSRTNYCDIAVRENGEFIVIVSAIDNLIKGASGAAVQNLNCMYGWPQTTGLLP
jgi:N-acetyl-gamma-glutamyl-phosphate reductase